jgi:hypothetical protein
MPLFACMAINITSMANDGHIAPSPFNTYHFIASVKAFDVMNRNNASVKVCACQILNLHSNNLHVKNAVVFAEKTNTNDGDNDLDKARLRLEKEKRMLRILFYNKIQVIGRTTAATDCNTLFLQLKKKQADLLLYEILNADIIVK